MCADRVYPYMVRAEQEAAKWASQCRGEQLAREARGRAEAAKAQAMIPPSHDSGSIPPIREYGPPPKIYYEKKAANEQASAKYFAGLDRAGREYEAKKGRSRSR